MKSGDVIEKRNALAREGILTDKGREFSLRQDNILYYMTNRDVAQIPVDQPLSLTEKTPHWLAMHLAVYRRYKGIHVVIHSRLPYTVTAARAGRTVPPLLDDFAQLVGVTAHVVRSGTVESAFSKSIARGLRRRNAVLIQHGAGLCAAGTFDDAVAVAQVLEKNCRALVYTAFLGGGKRINLMEAWLMRLVYRYKYSRMGLASTSASEGSSRLPGPLHADD